MILKRSDLKPFQERAASELAAMIQDYPSARFKPRFDPDTGELMPFLCRLRAITGAGKTPILALAARHLKTGIVLWTTNRGAVISQTLTNLRPGGRYSELLPEGTQIHQLSELTDSDWQEMLQAQNGLTILLSTVAAFNQDGDVLRVHRKLGDFTPWEMLAGKGLGSSQRRPLYVFYDEGHGATENQFKKLLELDPRAFVLASASPLPEDLADLLSGKTQEERERSLAERTFAVPTKEVVLAGLLKSRLYFVDCNTAEADAIKEANDKWKDLAAKLAPYKRSPIACFIVNETVRGVDVWQHLVALGIPKGSIAVHLNKARDVIFQREGDSLGLIDTYTGRKSTDRSPEILASMGYTHIIWNMTLREGWDEPMAYVAYIDDRGRSAVDIVQKIGRFVRQPDATPFEDPDLNSAYFYFKIPDEEFAALIKETQQEMETNGYEVISFTGRGKPPSSRVVNPIVKKTIPSIVPWFGDRLDVLDKILLDHVPLFADKALKASGSVRTRVFDMAELDEDKSKRKDVARGNGDATTPWDYLTVRLAAIDSRIIRDNSTIFSGPLKDHEKMKQRMQYGSDAMMQLENSIQQVRDDLNNQFRLVAFGRQLYEPKPFKLISPDIVGVTGAIKEKYKVRRFKHSVHPEYNSLSPFEVEVAEALDSLGRRWCRNPANKDGYRIPIPELGSDTIWFYPDFVLWTKDAIWCIDPKGKHLLDAAIVQKLLDFSGVKNLTTPIKVAFVLEGSFVADRQGSWSKTGTQGFTLVRKSTTGPKGYPYSDLRRLVRAFVRD
ncbi:MAG TPA: DEAD/DEAH box helicase family protein [Pyrinomonadaceae bacterium]|nr:DEAD/DEAH box helicase family protein [Pyrinomonadaceae bacterium]